MRRRLLMLCLIGCAGLSGCVEKTLGTVSQDVAVSWGNTGSIFGGGQTTVLPDDSVIVTWTGGAGEQGESIRQGPQGTFVQVDQRMRMQLARLSQVGDPVCNDYGTTFVERRGSDGAIERAETHCRMPEFDAAIAALGDVLAPLLDRAEE